MKFEIGRAPDAWARVSYSPFVAHLCKIIWKGGLAFAAHQIGSLLRIFISSVRECPSILASILECLGGSISFSFLDSEEFCIV